MTYNFVQSAELYYNLYEKSREEGELDMAAEYLLEAIRLSRSIDYKIELADLYSEMNQLDMSNDECFHILVKEHRNSECLNILSNNFSYKKNFRAAYFYFSKADNLGLDDYSDYVTSDEDFDIDNLGFKLVWANGVRDCSDIKDEIEMLIAVQNYKEAIKLLSTIPSSATQYNWAQKVLVLCNYMIGDYLSAIDLIDSIIESSEDDISLLSVAYNIMVETEKKEKANELVDRIIKIKPKEANDILKAVYCIMDCNRFQDAITFILENLSSYPYNDSIMLLLASAYYMIGEIEKSKQILRKLINMYGNRTYAKFYLDSVNLSEGIKGGISYGIPANRALKIQAFFDNNSDLTNIPQIIDKNKDIKSMLKWYLENITTESSSSYYLCFLLTKSSAGIRFLEEMLLNEKINGELKVGIVYHLISSNYKKRICIVYDNYFRIVNSIDNSCDSNLIEAYSMCAVYLAPMLKQYEDEIYKACIRINKAIKASGKSFQSVEALAALIIYYSKELEISKDGKILAGLFGASLQTYKKYIKIIDEVII